MTNKEIELAFRELIKVNNMLMDRIEELNDTVIQHENYIKYLKSKDRCHTNKTI